ncbi:MAG: nicotinamide mononucleotide transporter [Chitinophagaceae bacterium]|nr:nicotinamide mononucleotide transporter [Chitinophagaceae bacterium]
MDTIWQQFLEGMKHTGWLEYVAVFAGIASVWFSRIENIWVYPVGLINTVIYIYLSFKFHLPGEASVNFYYTVMSLYGWYLWMKKIPGRKAFYISAIQPNNCGGTRFFSFFSFMG